MKKKSLIAALALMPILASAQALHIEIADTALQKGAQLWVGYTYANVDLDKNGVYNMDGKDLKDKGTAALMLNDYSFYRVVLEPNKKLSIKIANKGGKRIVKYSGPNAPMAEMLNEFDKFTPARNYDVEQNMHSTDTVSFAEAFRQNDERHAKLVKMVGKIKDEHDRTTCGKSVLMKYLGNKITLQKGYLKAYKQNPNTDNTLKNLMAEVKPNDSDYVSYGLVTELVEYNMPKDQADYKNATEYTIDYMNSIDRTVTDKKLKDELLEGFIGKYIDVPEMDIEKFWKRACEICSKDVQKKYQYIVDSKKATKSGMKCPDATFSDADGKQHHLSEFFGKVLYIDLWATWCGPCCMEIPYMEKMVEHYKDNDKIKFISISVDEDRKAWLNKIQKDKPAWSQFNTSKNEYITLAKQWGISGIPRFLIINADGTINNADAFRPSDDNFVKNIDELLK